MNTELVAGAVYTYGHLSGFAHAPTQVKPGQGCCIQKANMSSDLHPASKDITVIDLGTTPLPLPPCHHPSPPPSPPSPSVEALRPWFHFTRLSGEMNDPNGLQWRRIPGE